MDHVAVFPQVRPRAGEAPRLPVHHIVVPSADVDRLNREIGRLTAELRKARDELAAIKTPEHQLEVGEFAISVTYDGATLPAIAFWDCDCRCAGVSMVSINGAWVATDGFDADVRESWNEDADIQRRAQQEDERRDWDESRAEMLALDRACGD